VTWERIGDRPTGSIPVSHPLVQAALTALRRHGLSGRTAVASTDANVPLSRGYPAICLGLTTGGGAHTLNEFIHTRPLNTGLAVLAETVAAASRL
jgi:acetylornithine deacetylase/succinyl-diaminopimelate desuccinylase-like protein